MGSTKACQAGALITSCAEDASQGCTCIRCTQNCKGSDGGGLFCNWIRYLFISN